MTNNFYGYGKTRFQIVMLHAGRKKYGDGYKSEVWVGKVRGMMKMKCKPQQRPGTTLCGM